MMRQLAVNGYQQITPSDATMMIDYFEEHCGDRQISLRLLGPSLRKLKYARQEGIDWRPLIKSQLQSLGRKQEATKRLDNKAKDLRTLQQIIKLHPESVQDQQAAWCKAIKKSRASFYRTLSRFRSEAGQ